MWSVSTQRHSYCLRLHNLPTDVTAQVLTEFFSSRVGISLEPSCFDIQHNENGSVSALAAIPRRALADFLERAVADQRLDGKQIVIRPNFVRPEVTPNDGRD